MPSITYSFLHLLPPISAAQPLCPHAELDWFQRHLWLKIHYVLAHGISHFVDDDPKVLALFERFAPVVVTVATSNRGQLKLLP